MYCSVVVSSGRRLSEATKELVVRIASEEARKARGSYSFVLHEAFEDSAFIELVVEGREPAINSLVVVLADTLPGRVTRRTQP